MRIGFITTSFPRFHGDFAGNFVFHMARSFARRGHRITVLAPSHESRGNMTRDWLDGIELIQVPTGAPGLFYGAGVPDNLRAHPELALKIPAAALAFYWRLAAVSHRLDAMVSHWMLPSALIAGTARTPIQKHLAIAHSSDIHLLSKSPASRHLALGIAESADHLGFVTERLRSAFLSILPERFRGRVSTRTHITPMGVEAIALETPESRESARMALGVKGFCVLQLGRLVPIKGADLTLEAIQSTDVHLVVAGEGPEREALERHATGEKVIFTGQVGPNRRAELFRACDAVVVPSRRLDDGRVEGLPTVILEALAAGRPVIASEIADTDGLLEKWDSGIRIPENDVTALASAIHALKTNPDRARRLGTNGTARARERDWSTLAARYETLLQLRGIPHTG